MEGDVSRLNLREPMDLLLTTLIICVLTFDNVEVVEKSVIGKRANLWQVVRGWPPPNERISM